MMTVPEFLRDLPTHDSANFSLVSSHAGSGASFSRTQRSATHLVPTKEDEASPKARIIVTEKTSVMLRYLHEMWDRRAKASAGSKRKTSKSEDACDASNGGRESGGLSNATRILDRSSEDNSGQERKRMRIDSLIYGGSRNNESSSNNAANLSNVSSSSSASP